MAVTHPRPRYMTKNISIKKIQRKKRKKISLIIIGTMLLFQIANADMCPDGSYVSGDCSLAPDGSYTGGGGSSLAPDGSYVGGANNHLKT